MGPHGLMIGMTGSGKSQTLMSILLSLLTTHSADRLIVIYADFKGEAGADIFRDFPQVVAVISNMAEKRSLADRFADTLRGEVARREQLLMETGRRVQGSAFNSVTEYETAIAAGHDLPPIPTLLVVADEFSLMLSDHPEYADLFDYVARKGRSFRIHILFASQTLDVGRIKDIDKNTSYRIGLKVASPSVSRQIIGVEDAYHIESGREHKGVGFLVPAPGALPIKFRSTYVDGIYEPPRVDRSIVVHAIPVPQLFNAGWVDPDPTPSSSTTGRTSRIGRRASSSPRSAISSRTTDPTPRGYGCLRWTSRSRSTTCSSALKSLPGSGAGRSGRSTDRSRCDATRWSSTPTRLRPTWSSTVGRSRASRRRCRPSCCPRRRCTRRATSRSTASTTAAGSCARSTISRTSAAWPRRWSRSAFAAPSASSISCFGNARSSAHSPATVNTVTASVRCSCSSTTSTPSAGTTPTRSTPGTRCWPESPSSSMPGCPMGSMSSSPLPTGSRCRWRCAMDWGCGWSCRLHDAHDSNVRVVGALRRPADSSALRRPADGVPWTNRDAA